MTSTGKSSYAGGYPAGGAAFPHRDLLAVGRLERHEILFLLDEAEHHPDPARRATAAGHVAILTPVAKSLFTELGHRSADEALQVWGGYGFVVHPLLDDENSARGIMRQARALAGDGTAALAWAAMGDARHGTPPPPEDNRRGPRRLPTPACAQSAGVRIPRL